MKKSLFRFTDSLELFLAYSFCFSLNLAFDYGRVFDSNILKDFLEYQVLIVSLFTFVAAIFHYQMRYRKKTEVFCKILAGDTVWNIMVRYFLDCLTILALVWIIFRLINAYFHFSVTGNLYFIPIFITYILISAWRLKSYEDF